MNFRLAGSVLVVAALTFSACGDDTSATGDGDSTEVATATTAGAGEAATDPGDDVTRLWILPTLVDCIGEAQQKCMQVAEAPDGEYLFFYDGIEGFTFNEGTAYVLDVKIEEVADPPADGSSLKYTLVEIIEET